MTLQDQRELEFVLPRLLDDLDALSSVDEQMMLGVLFYERLTGKAPTKTVDSNFEFDFENHPYIPLTVSLIIQKMTYRNQADRYQSLQGLRDDLSRCLHELQSCREISKFFPGKSDKPSDLQFTNYLYGREAELQQISDIVSKHRGQHCSLLMVSGYSGVGKTSLIEEAISSALPSSSLFIRGKFDQTLNQPYAAFVTAVTDLVSQIQGQEKSEQETWKRLLNEALHPNAQVLIKVMPDLELIIGPQPVVIELDTEQSKNRFNTLVQQFFQVLIDQRQELILFLDDLQWIDAASLSLIQVLIEQFSAQFLVIGAYRDNECDDQHPLTIFMQELRPAALERISLKSLSKDHTQKQVAGLLQEIPLQGLKPSDVQVQIQDLFKANAKEAAPLAELIHSKTHGNPFFTKQLIASLKSDELIHFNADQKRWSWNLLRIKEQDVSDNVGEFMAKQFEHLAEDTKELLLYAACLGHTFNLNDLSKLLHKDELQLELSLWVAVNRGIIAEIHKSESSKQYKFLHDRIQQAAYQSRSENDLLHCHFAIAKSLDASKEALSNSDFLKMVDHYNVALPVMDELTHIVELNIEAIQIAKETVAFDLAYRYVNQALELLDRVDMQASTKNVLKIELAHCCYLTGRFEQSEHEYLQVLNSDLDVDTKIDCYCKLAVLYVHTGRPDKATALLRPTLALLGIKMPKRVTTWYNKLLYWAFKFRYMTTPKSAIKSVDETMNKQTATMHKIHRYFSTATYMADMKINVYQKFVAALFDMRYRGETIYMSLITQIIRNEKDLNYAKYLFLEQNFKSREDPESNDYYGKGGYITPYIYHISEAILDLEASAIRARNKGELTFSSYSLACITIYTFMSGLPLSDFLELCERNIAVLEKNKEKMTIKAVKEFPYVAQKLVSGKTVDQAEIDQISKQLEGEFFKMGLATFYLSLLQYYVIFNDGQKAKLYSDKLITVAPCGQGMLFGDEYKFLRALVDYINAQAKPLNEKIKTLYQCSSDLKWMKKLSRLNPNNFSHWYSLLRAERYRLLGQGSKAKRAYQNAIKSANDNGFIHYAAIAAERAGDIEKALEYYQKWGAESKVQQLKQV